MIDNLDETNVSQQSQSERQFAETLHHLENSEAIREAYFKNNQTSKWFWQRKQKQQEETLPISSFDELVFASSSKIQEQNDNSYNTDTHKKMAMASTSAAAISAITTNNLPFFGFFKSGESLLKGFLILLAIGSVSLPFVAYNMKLDGISTLTQNANVNANEDVGNANKSSYKIAHFEPIDRVDPNAMLETDMSKAIVSNGEGESKADITDEETMPTVEQVATLMPTSKAFTVKDVNNGMALIEYDQGYWFAKPGSYLPDGSVYLKAKTNIKTGKVELHTSLGVVPVEK